MRKIPAFNFFPPFLSLRLNDVNERICLGMGSSRNRFDGRVLMAINLRCHLFRAIDRSRLSLIEKLTRASQDGNLLSIRWAKLTIKRQLLFRRMRLERITLSLICFLTINGWNKRDNVPRMKPSSSAWTNWTFSIPFAALPLQTSY